MTVFDLVSMFSRYVHRMNDIEVTQMCGLAEGTNAHTIKTANDIVYVLYNQQVTLTHADNIAMTACSAQAISSFCYYLVSVNLAMAVTITKGADNTYALPSTPAANVPIGAILVTTDAGHTFTSGTDDLSGAGITAVCYDIDTGMASQLINQAQARLERGVTIVRDGRQRTIMDFDHMLVRAQATISQGDDTVTLPFPNYKDFVDNRLTIYDPIGDITYPIFRADISFLGTVVQNRPVRISRMPGVETVFTTDGAPAIEFDIWPESDNTYIMDVTAYQYSPALDGVIYTHNWLTDNAPDVLLFGALVETAGYFTEVNPKMAEWKDRWQEAVWTLYAAQNKEKYSGSFIYTKFPDLLGRKATSSDVSMGSNYAGIASFGFIDTST